MQLPWYIAALGAAITWGIHYPLIDFAMKRVSVYAVLLLSVIPILLAMPIFIRQLGDDLETLTLLPPGERLAVLAVGLTSTLGAVLVYLAINSKNATLASLIEISYPVFVVLFAWVIFREFHITSSVLSGGLMILFGAGLIIYNN